MESSLSAEQYLTVSELTAIVRLANALDRSHLQKIQAIRAIIKGARAAAFAHGQPRFYP